MTLTTFYSKVYPSQTFLIGIALADADKILQQGLKSGRQEVSASKTAGAALPSVVRHVAGLASASRAHAKQAQLFGGTEVHSELSPAQSFGRMTGTHQDLDQSVHKVNELFLGVPKDAVQEIMQNGFGLPNNSSSIPLARSHVEARAAFARSAHALQECAVLTVQARRAVKEGGCTLRARAHGCELHLPGGVGKLASTFIEQGTPPGRKVTRFASQADNVVLAGRSIRGGSITLARELGTGATTAEDSNVNPGRVIRRRSITLARELGNRSGATTAEDDNGLFCKSPLRPSSAKELSQTCNSQCRASSCPAPRYSSIGMPLNSVTSKPKRELSIDSSTNSVTSQGQRSYESARLMLGQSKAALPSKASKISFPFPKISSFLREKENATQRSELMHDQKPLNSPLTTAQDVPVCFSVEDLHVVDSHDPNRDPSLKAQLLSNLGLFEESCIIKRVRGRCGGQNEGVWTIQDNQHHNMLIAKLVQSRGFYGFSSEVQKLEAIYKAHPSISSDASVAFPLKAFHCVGPNASHYRDFVLMRKASGEPLGDVITDKYRDGRMPEVVPILREFGTFLAHFHKRYGGCQHGDLHWSNIFYETATRTFTLIDVADMGNSSVQKNDMEYFVETLEKMKVMRAVLSEGVRSFEEGYRMGT